MLGLNGDSIEDAPRIVGRRQRGRTQLLLLPALRDHLSDAGSQYLHVSSASRHTFFIHPRQGPTLDTLQKGTLDADGFYVNNYQYYP